MQAGALVATHKHRHANFVVQLAIRLAVPSVVELLAHQLLGQASAVAQVPCGCHVLQRIWEQLADGLAANCKLPELLCHQYGNFVVASAILHAPSDAVRAWWLDSTFFHSYKYGNTYPQTLFLLFGFLYVDP